jgi:hypothetical protein
MPIVWLRNHCLVKALHKRITRVNAWPSCLHLFYKSQNEPVSFHEF